MCNSCRRERQLEQGIRQNSNHLIFRPVQERANPRADQATSTTVQRSVPEKEPPRKRNTLHKRRKQGDQPTNAPNQWVERDEADAEARLNTQDTTETRSSTQHPTNEHEAAQKPTWLRVWLGKLFMSTFNNSSSQTAETSFLPRIFSFGETQRTDQSQISAKSREPNPRGAKKSLSSIFSFRRARKQESLHITASNSPQPNTPNMPHSPAPSPRPSSPDITHENKEAASNTKRKRRSLTVHWRNTEPSASEHLLVDQQQQQQQHETGKNKTSNRRDSAGIWNEAWRNDEANGDENEGEWYDANDPDRLLLENWSLHHQALVEHWQGN